MDTTIKEKEIGSRIKRLREDKDYSQDYLAQRLGITQKAYSKIETNQTRLSVDNLLKIADVLETSINKILDVDGGTVYNNYSTHHGEGIVIHKTTSDKIIELYDKLLKAKDDEIEALKKLLIGT
ncbi:transcriptional regulator [Taibaiella sp. KBW10]|uniref:helix-turn-helix domain-containing protein n=1 Tax=Taibaiella sp. KBW10 TaxID=2153357 RepID=UPI000F5B1E1B|nr:helix-turn-helix transcriptional regulator [Taibaiella sp. KBW10]RQO32643.1 transcriptional regulator [Taibaiella sp. KBW10]